MSRCVLLLEDDDQLRDMLVEVIRTVAGRPCLGLRSLTELRDRRDEALACELAILDVNLGRDSPSGLDAYGWLRAERFAGRIAFLTGHAIHHPLVERAKRLDGVQVLQKPLLNESILRLLKS